MKFTKVTISGLICTGKSTVFKRLKEQLGWPAFSASQFFREYSTEHHVSLENAEEQSKNVSNEVDFSMREIVKAEGNVIVEGWMAGYMAREEKGVLRVLLTCDDDVRAARFAQRENLSLEEARKKIEARESNLFKKLESIYGANDVLNPLYFNHVINTSTMSSAAVVQSILAQLVS